MKEANVTQLARLMNVSRQAVYKAERDGRIQRNPNGKFNVEKTLGDWEANTRYGHGGKRESQANQWDFNPPLFESWLDLVNQSYPYMALEFARHWKMSPAKVWKLLGMVFFLELCAVAQLCEIPEGAILYEVFEYRGFANKLREWPYSQELNQWLVGELKKEEGDPMDPSIWE